SPPERPGAPVASARLATLLSPRPRRVVLIMTDGFLVVLHHCGSRGYLTGSMVPTGARGLHLGNARGDG
ncbi:MAG TPA: hypothetical protein VFG59_13785, partial [Anaeromyxobacter sp.]|nr:hypothetical protein [Anaeromyxobacter sp.]